MNKKVTNIRISLRFRRWSRARYAVFVSMSCAVTIGVLAFSVCEKSEFKAIGRCVFNNESSLLTTLESDGLSAEELLTAAEIAIISENQYNDASARGFFYNILLTQTVETDKFLF